MDEEIERLVVSVRADTRSFARDVDAMRASLDGPLASGAERAGRSIESALTRAVRTGRLGFDDLRDAGIAALDAIAASAIRTGIGAIAGGGSAGGLLGGLLGLGAGLIGAPGRATGGPVTAGRPYLVGERGPELFVPPGEGRIVPQTGGSPRDVRVAISINAPAGTGPQALQRSSRQVARAVRSALAQAE